MFDIGFWEIMIITLVALLVVGPERLPGLAREIGRFVGKAKRFVNSVRSDIEQELQTEELRKMLKSQEDEIQQLKSIMRDTEDQLRGDIEASSKTLREDLDEAKSALRDAGQELNPAEAWNRPSAIPRVPVAHPLGENLETELPRVSHADRSAEAQLDRGAIQENPVSSQQSASSPPGRTEAGPPDQHPAASSSRGSQA